MPNKSMVWSLNEKHSCFEYHSIMPDFVASDSFDKIKINRVNNSYKQLQMKF
jgi:hypothetical protein